MSAKYFPTKVALTLLLACSVVPLGRTQQRAALRFPEPPHTSTEAVLRLMTQAAGIIFAGEVVAVRRPAGFAGSAQDATEGTVAIEFRVDQAVRGCTRGSIITMREWAGLWTGGARYQVGQRLLVFLHAPDRGGLTSPVGGKVGVVPLRGGGLAPGPYDAGSRPSEWLADLRWVHAQALLEGARPRASGTSPATPARPITGQRRTIAVSDETSALLTDPFLPVAEQSLHWKALPQADESATQPLSQILGLCREWVRATDGTL